MKSTWKKLACGLLAAVMLLGLAACGGGSTETEAPATDAPTTDAPVTDAPETGAPAEGTEDFSGQTLTVANWQSYGTDADYGAAAFEELYGCKVEHYFISSVPELMQTLLNGGMDQIDVICINPVYIQEYFANGVIEPIDTAALSNYADLRSDLTDIEDVKDSEGNVLGVPWIWGTTSLFYNADVVTEEITSWSALWDEAYAGKVGFFDDHESAIKVAAMKLGQDPYTPDLEAVEQELISLKPNVKTYWGTYDDFVKAYTAGDIVIGNVWGSIATQLKAEGYNIQYVYPEEGTVGWCDYWCLVSGSAEKELAMKWIDFCTGSDFQNGLATDGNQAYAPANQVVLDALDEETQKNLWIYPSAPDNMFLSLQMDSDTLNEWINLWTNVKAAA